MLQRLKDTDSGRWSNSDHYVVGTDKQKAPSPLAGRRALGIAKGVAQPPFAGAVWEQAGVVGFGSSGPEVPVYRLRWREDRGVVKVPKDCLTTAELVAAWLANKNLQEIGEVRKVPEIFEYIPRTIPRAALRPGDILFHVHDAKVEGDFHGAAIIASDRGDVVTMESDASSGPRIASASPLFDMYAGRGGFEGEQKQAGGKDERTYVISFLKTPEARSAEKLWAGITEMEFSGPAETALEKIKSAIEGELAKNG
jgi:hypothetical protein